MLLGSRCNVEMGLSGYTTLCKQGVDQHQKDFDYANTYWKFFNDTISGTKLETCACLSFHKKKQLNVVLEAIRNTENTHETDLLPSNRTL